MTKLNNERKGPPRPGSASMDHPGPIERPYVHVSRAEKARLAAERRKEQRERGEAIREAEREAIFAEHEKRFGPLPTFGKRSGL